jgi:hypothetical protein
MRREVREGVRTSFRLEDVDDAGIAGQPAELLAGLVRHHRSGASAATVDAYEIFRDSTSRV